MWKVRGVKIDSAAEFFIKVKWKFVKNGKFS